PALLFLTAGGYDPGIPLTIYFLLLLFWTFLPCRDLLKYHYGQVKSALQRRTVRRKLYRYCGLIFPCIIYPLGGQKALLLSLGIGTLTLWSVELIRKYNPTVRSMIMSVMEPVAKEEEETEITGTSKYILGCFLASIFPDPLNALSIIMLTLGDAWAGLVGRRTGLGIWIKGKSTSGSIACLTACVSASYVFIHMTPSYHLDLEIILAGSLVATLAEGVSGKWDNLFIAPAAALAMWLLL
ncbi:MAG: hypothetical protein JW971_01205, partial [Synergistales bacterium]|nr:hypothetical protein [Synergistales bacterium]